MRKDRFYLKYGPWAIIAGGSQGIGEAFARELAARGCNLVLIARRKEKLEKLAENLIATYNIEIRAISADLADFNGHQKIFSETNDIEIGTFVYNAAKIPIGYFLDFSLEDQIQVIDINCKSPVIFIDHYARKMKLRSKGAIILVSSMAGFQGTPINAHYAATKAYNSILAEGLWYELKEYGIDVISCQAGSTATPNYIETEPEYAGFFVPKPMKPMKVAKSALRKLGKKPSMVPGLINKIASFMVRRIFSRKLAIKTIGASTFKMYGYKLKND